MSRRQLNATDESDRSLVSLSDSIRSMAIAGLRYVKQPFTDEELQGSTPEQFSNYNAAHSDVILRRFEELGKGQCGTVYGLLGTTTVAKLPNAQGKVSELHADYLVHLQVQDAIREHDPDHIISVRVPKLDAWHAPNSRFWVECGLLFDPNVEVSHFAIVSERVLPAPFPVREAIFDTLMPATISSLKQDFLAQPENKNCLIRMYLGRRHTTKVQDKAQNVKLQNFPLHVNEMESVGLDTAHFARLMANTLAIMHWGAMVDGNDIEFVLGSSPAKTKSLRPEAAKKLDMWQLSEAINVEFTQRSMEMWLIDFNQCAFTQDDEAGIDKLVKAFVFNDPYYPRPGSTDSRDKGLWNVFRNEYLDTSRKITRSSGPNVFISRLEREFKGKTIDGLF